MTASTPLPGSARRAPAAGPLTLVWIDSREAILMRWNDGTIEADRMHSDVPAHHRATGHVRHQPNIRHGGGGRPQTAGEPRRLDHLARFLDAVAKRVPPADALLLVGPGTVHEHLAGLLRDREADHPTARDIRCEPASRMTRAQLTARLRGAVGAEPRRQTAGAYRWSRDPARAASGRHLAVPCRVAARRRPGLVTEPLED
jgi:hypothetical protein